MLRNKRLLRTREFEFFEIINHDDDTLGYLTIIDTKRPSRLSDFPELVGIEIEEDFDKNANHIKADIFKLPNFNQDSLEETYLFIEDLIGLKPDCSYHVSEHNIRNILEFDLPNHMLGIVEFVYELLLPINVNMDFSGVSEETFNYLSQD